MLKLNVGIIELIPVLITWGPLLLIGALVLFLIFRSKKSRDGITAKMLELQPNEIVVTGNWVVLKNGSVVSDDACRRIEWLVEMQLERLAADPSGWETLYRDPRDGRLWEYTYPQSGMHGGGPPQLLVISPEVAATKYRLGPA